MNRLDYWVGVAELELAFALVDFGAVVRVLVSPGMMLRAIGRRA